MVDVGNDAEITDFFDIHRKNYKTLTNKRQGEVRGANLANYPRATVKRRAATRTQTAIERTVMIFTWKRRTSCAAMHSRAVIFLAEVAGVLEAVFLVDFLVDFVAIDALF